MKSISITFLTVKTISTTKDRRI